MNPETPLVSVVIPAYDRGHALSLCLGALRAQTYPAIEIIVVDDCGTGDVPQVAKAAGATVLRTPRNSGQSAARNLGAAHARGQILFFLDADIALDADAIANAVAVLRSDPRLGAVCGILHPEPLVSTSLAARYRGLQMYHWWMPTGRPTRELHAALLAVPTTVFDEIGPFDTRRRDTEAADYRSRLVRRYDVRLTGEIRGRHDHDPTLRLILRKVFRRARVSALEWRRGELPGDSVSRAFAGVLLSTAVLASPLPFLVAAAGGAQWTRLLGAAVPVLLAAGAVALDAATYRSAFARRGPLFGAYFAAVHLLVTLVGTAGMGVGVLQRALLTRRPGPGATAAAERRPTRA